MPAGHPWQDSFLQALQILMQRGDTRVVDDEPYSLWKDLPYLSISIREKFMSPRGEDLDELTRWKNFSSFIARYVAYEYLVKPNDPDEQPASTLSIWAVREGLEEPLSKGPEGECLVWVATEWIINVADTLFMEIHTKAEVGEVMTRVAATHELAQDIVPHSPERWAFWKKRLAEISASAGEMEMGSSIVGRIAKALEIMESVEVRGPAGGQADSSLERGLPAEGKADLRQEGEASIEDNESLPREMEGVEAGREVPTGKTKGAGAGKEATTQEMEGVEEGKEGPTQETKGHVEEEANPTQEVGDTAREKADSTEGLEGTAEGKVDTTQKVEAKDNLGS